MSGYSHLLPSMGKCELNLLNGYYIGIGGDDENANFQKLNSHRNPPIGTKSIAECHFYWIEEFFELTLGLKFNDFKLAIRTSCAPVFLNYWFHEKNSNKAVHTVLPIIAKCPENKDFWISWFQLKINFFSTNIPIGP